jgi:glycosyltransferase involved in cell wall biosynthesis
MDENHQVLSHQVEVVNRLASKFDQATVLTGKVGKYNVAENVSVICFNWIEGQRLKSILKFLRIFIKTISEEKFSVIFSHMTSVHSAFVSPITKIKGIRHYLWYAHTSNGIYLQISKLLADGIITSTPGSCPIKGKKVFPIGQSIDSKRFIKRNRNLNEIRKLIHIGRFDPSKNIDLIIKVVDKLRDKDRDLELEIVGSPSTELYKLEAKKIINKYNSNYKWLKFTPYIPRDLIPKTLLEADCFIHAFAGSLDKTLVEATFSGLPVITINNEYRQIFGSWHLNNPGNISSLEDEAMAFFAISVDRLEIEIDRRHKIAVDNHEILGWVDRLVRILKS